MVQANLIHSIILSSLRDKMPSYNKCLVIRGKREPTIPLLAKCIDGTSL